MKIPPLLSNTGIDRKTKCHGKRNVTKSTSRFGNVCSFRKTQEVERHGQETVGLQ